MGVREEGKNRRRDRITAAARSLIQSGDSGFRMRALAEEAGVSIATPYNLFGSKQAILTAVMDADLSRFKQTLAMQHVDSLAMFSKTVTIARELIDLDPQFYRNVMLTTNAPTPDVDRTRLLHWKQLIENGVADGFLLTFTEPLELAIHLRQMYSSAFHRWAKGEISTREAEAQVKYAITLALAGVATPVARQRLQSHLRTYQETLRTIRMNKICVSEKSLRSSNSREAEAMHH
ncbi:MAG: AcrR family transcriptional regulator [Candidatus Azotimanducaceae bacterium]|jgi:AcrR family transcriptional regulator